MAILEVYLEATPTVFIYIMLLVYSIQNSGDTPQETELEIQFFGSFISSIVSAAFGIAR